MTGPPESGSAREDPGAAAGVTAGEALATARVALGAAGIDTSGLDASLLLGHCLGLSRETLLGHPERLLDAVQYGEFAALIARRGGGEPVSRILGEREFWSLPFGLTPAVLDPRPDSECVVETALAAVSESHSALRVADLGTGTGCLLLALLTELPNATGVGLDISVDAVAVARANARVLGLDARAHFVAGDWGAPLAGPFELIVVNPPYIPEPRLSGLAAEVAHDPRLALAAGADGLAAFRALAPHLARLLGTGGRAVLEVGDGQATAVQRLLEAAGLAASGSGYDLAGRERCIIANRRENLPVKRKKGLE